MTPVGRDERRPTPTDRDGIAVDLYVRPAQLEESLGDYIATLNRMERDGVLDGVTIHTWPSKVPARSPTTDVVERFREFRSWADANDATIQPPFSVRTVESEFTGETGTYISTPVLCMAVRDDESLVGVYPYTAGTEHHSIADGIERLQAGEVPSRNVQSTAAAFDGTCAECGGTVVNVQGIDACHDCAWVDHTASSTLRTVTVRYST